VGGASDEAQQQAEGSPSRLLRRQGDHPAQPAARCRFWCISTTRPRSGSAVAGLSLRRCAATADVLRVSRSTARELAVEDGCPRPARASALPRIRVPASTSPTSAFVISAAYTGRSESTESMRSSLRPGYATARWALAHECFLRERSSASRCWLDPAGSRYRPNPSAAAAAGQPADTRNAA
jgi:hypothetical protein